MTPDLPDGASGFFFTEGLDRPNQIEMAEQIGRCTHCQFGRLALAERRNLPVAAMINATLSLPVITGNANDAP
ncbi:MAG: hypothetical protein WA418_38135 [Bradyrhizobium sp.]